MNTLLDTQQITSDKSTFLVDIVKSNSGKLYVQLSQSINATSDKLDVAKLNPEVLTDIIAALQYCHSIINVASKIEHHHIDDKKDLHPTFRYFLIRANHQMLNSLVVE